LPEKQRLVFIMKYFDDIKYEEMSEILGTSVGALKASYHHAVKKVEDYIKSNETAIEFLKIPIQTPENKSMWD